jgi:hypothetical protein
MRTMTLGMCAIGLLTSGACVADHEDVAAEVYARTVLGNGVDLNSASMNGRTLNGFFMNGRTLNGRTLNAWSLNGRTLNGRTLNGTLFAGTQVVDGQVVTVSGTQMIGSLLTIRADGVDLTLRFDDIYKDPANPTGDVYFYDVSVHDAVAGTWTSLCADDEGQPLAAIPLQHYWNPVTGARVNDADAVTFACRGAVLAKCVEWGYRPWASATRCVNGTCTQVSLADHHQACTRMARADYCGDGTPHTFDGDADRPLRSPERAGPGGGHQVRLGLGDRGRVGPERGAVCRRRAAPQDVRRSQHQLRLSDLPRRHRRRQQLREFLVQPRRQARQSLLLQVDGRPLRVRRK